MRMHQHNAMSEHASFPALLVVVTVLVIAAIPTVSCISTSTASPSRSASILPDPPAPPPPSSTATRSSTLTRIPAQKVTHHVALTVRVLPPLGTDVLLLHRKALSRGGFFVNASTGSVIARGSNSAADPVVLVRLQFEFRRSTRSAATNVSTTVVTRTEPARGVVVQLFASNNESYWHDVFGKSGASNISRDAAEHVPGTVPLAEGDGRSDANGIVRFPHIACGRCLRDYELLAVPETRLLGTLVGVEIDEVELLRGGPLLHVAAARDQCIAAVSAENMDDLHVMPIWRYENGTEAASSTRPAAVAVQNSSGDAGIESMLQRPLLVRFEPRAGDSRPHPARIDVEVGEVMRPLFVLLRDSCGASIQGLGVIRATAHVASDDAARAGQRRERDRVLSGVTSLNLDGSGGISGQRVVGTSFVEAHMRIANAPHVLNPPVMASIPSAHVAVFENLSIALDMSNIDREAHIRLDLYAAKPAPEHLLQQTRVSRTTSNETVEPEPLDARSWSDDMWLAQPHPCATLQIPLRTTKPSAATQQAAPRRVKVQTHVDTFSAAAMSSRGASVTLWSAIDAFHPVLGGASAQNASLGPVLELVPEGTDLDDPDVQARALQVSTFLPPALHGVFFSVASSVNRRRAPRGFLYNVEENRNLVVMRRRRVELTAISASGLSGEERLPPFGALFQLQPLKAARSVASVAFSREQLGFEPDTTFFNASALLAPGAGVFDVDEQQNLLVLNDTSRRLLTTLQFFYLQLLFLPSQNYFTNLGELVNISFSEFLLAHGFAPTVSHVTFNVAPLPITAATLGRRWFGLVAMFGDHVNLGTLAVIRHAGSCAIDEGARLDFVLHPLSFAVTRDPQRYFIGAVVGNVALVGGFTLLYFATSALAFGKEGSFPHLSLRLSYVLYPGTCLGALSCAFARDLDQGLFYFILTASAVIIAGYPILFLVLSQKSRAKWVSVRVETTEDDEDQFAKSLLTRKEQALLKERDEIEALKLSFRKAREIAAGGSNIEAPSETAVERITLKSRLAKFLISDGRYMYLHRDHLRFRATYQHFRGPTAWFGSVELLYALACSAAIFGPCPANTAIVISIVSIHACALFVLHPYFSIGRNIFAICVDVMFLTGSSMYLRGEERTAQAIFDVAEFTGSSLNTVGLLWSLWVSMAWRHTVQRLENFGRHHRIGCLVSICSHVGAHLDVLNRIDPDAEFEVFQQLQLQREERDAAHLVAAERMKKLLELPSEMELRELRGEDYDMLEDAVPPTTTDESDAPGSRPERRASPRTADALSATVRWERGSENSCAGGGDSSNGGAGRDVKAFRGGNRLNGAQGERAHEDEDEDEDEDSFMKRLLNDERECQAVIQDLVLSHRREVAENRSRCVGLATQADVPPLSREHAGAPAAEGRAEGVVGREITAKRKLSRGAGILTVGPHRAPSASGEDEISVCDGAPVEPEKAAALSRELETARRINEISWYQQEQRELEEAYARAKELADAQSLAKQREADLRARRYKRRLGFSDETTVVTRVFVDDSGVHEVRKLRPSAVGLDEATWRRTQKALRKERLLTLGIDEDSDSDGDDENRHRFETRFKLPPKRNLVLERMKKQNVKPIEEPSVMTMRDML